MLWEIVKELKSSGVLSNNISPNEINDRCSRSMNILIINRRVRSIACREAGQHFMNQEITSSRMLLFLS